MPLILHAYHQVSSTYMYFNQCQEKYQNLSTHCSELLNLLTIKDSDSEVVHCSVQLSHL